MVEGRNPHAREPKVRGGGKWLLILAAAAVASCSDGSGGAPAAINLDGANSGGVADSALPGGGPCAAGQTLCGGSCVDLQSNSVHCGACASACAPGSSCTAGICSCQADLTSCDGTCVDTGSDARHCGACGAACSADQVCADGLCGSTCPPGTTQCGSSCVDASSNPLHCGLCDNACTGGQGCLDGTCVCAAGQQLCGGSCVDTGADPSNCGGCGIHCTAAHTCTAGTCVGGGTGGPGTAASGTGGSAPESAGGSGTGTEPDNGTGGAGGDPTGTGGKPAGTGASTTASGGTATGGTAATGGTTATDTTPDMRDVPSTEIVEEMFLGWNLGNTLDSDPDETAWGNPLTSQAMIDAVHEAGFNTVRIPVTWMHHMGRAPNYAVDEEWMDRVEEVANYVLSAGMYAIINSHHDEWVSLMPYADHEEVATRLGKLWTQIATRFRDDGDHLIFETLNEPRTTDDTEWTGGTPEARSILNDYNLVAVNAIRATGGNNAIRHIMIPTHAANASTTCISDLEIPNDDPRIIVSLHTYYPNEFSMGGETQWGLNSDVSATQWGSDSDVSAMEAELDRIHDLLPRNGRAVVIGEWGTINQNNTSARVDHARTYARMVRERGMCPIWWDNGASARGADGFGLLNRNASPPTWYFPEIVSALVDGATAGAQ